MPHNICHTIAVVTMESPTYFSLYNGSKIPAIGLGTGGNLTGQYQRNLFALKHGVCHIETATMFVVKPLCVEASPNVLFADMDQRP